MEPPAPPPSHLAGSLKPLHTFELCFFLSLLPISQAFPGERLVAKKKKKKKGMAVSARTLMCGSVHARTPKLCAKLRVAPRSPPPRGRAEIEFIIQWECVPAARWRDRLPVLWLFQLCCPRGTSAKYSTAQRPVSHTHTHQQAGFCASAAKL